MSQPTYTQEAEGDTFVTEAYVWICRADHGISPKGHQPYRRKTMDGDIKQCLQKEWR